MDENLKKNVKFMGDQKRRDEAIQLIDSVLKEKGLFENFADLRSGIAGIASSYRIHIVDDDDSFDVTVEPVSGMGENLNFIVDKESRTLYRPFTDKAQPTGGDENIDFLDEL